MQNGSKRDFTHEFRHSAVMYAARVIHDSINIFGDRLTTAILTIPKWIQAELNTHRLLARNSASSRARPNHVVMTSIMEDPVIPVAFHRNARGMQGGAELVGVDLKLAQWAWLNIRDAVLRSEGYRMLTELDVHKQTINRTLEPRVAASGLRPSVSLRSRPAAEAAPRGQASAGSCCESSRRAPWP